MKPPTAMIASGQPIVRPRGDWRVDFEGELGVVIGKPCRRVSRQDALSYVAGYTIVNDVTVRDLQKKDGQFTRAKGFDSFCPCGPLPGRRRRSDQAAHRHQARRRGQAGRAHERHDLRHPDDHRGRLAGHDARAGRPHRHRHARGRRADPARHDRRDHHRRHRHPVQSRRGGDANEQASRSPSASRSCRRTCSPTSTRRRRRCGRRARTSSISASAIPICRRRRTSSPRCSRRPPSRAITATPRTRA